MPKIVGNYKLLKTIGKGNFSKVKEVLELSTNKKYIMKIIRISDINESGKKEEIKRRIDIFSKMNHPGIVSVHQLMHCDKNLYIIFDHVDNLLVRKIEKSWPLTEKVARKYFQQLIDILNYTHNNSAAFRDLHLENVIIDSRDNLKLTDFIFSNITNKRVLQDSQDPTRSTEPYFLRHYTAPEVYNVDGYVSPSADVFSVGVMLYYMLYNKFPYDGSSPEELEARKRNGLIELPNNIRFEPSTESHIKKLLTVMLNPEPHTRPSIAEIKRNKWFKEGYKEIKGGPNKAAAKDTQTTVTYSANSVNSNAKITEEINGFELVSRASPFNLNRAVDLSSTSTTFDNDGLMDSPTSFSIKKNSVETIALIDKMLKGYMAWTYKSKKERERKAIIPVVSKRYEVKFNVSKIEDELTLVQLDRISGDVVGFYDVYMKIKDHLNKQ